VQSQAVTAAKACFRSSLEQRGANYFSTVGLPVLRGRALRRREQAQTWSEVAIIDEPLAKKLWPDVDALGQRVQYAAKYAVGSAGGAASGTSAELSKKEKQDETIEIIGIVPRNPHDLFANEDRTARSTCRLRVGFQSDVSFFVRKVRSPPEPKPAGDLLRRACASRSLTPIISLQHLPRFLDSELDLGGARRRGHVLHFGGLALALASLSLRSQSLFGRARNTGDRIRMALGAQPGWCSMICARVIMLFGCGLLSAFLHCRDRKILAISVRNWRVRSAGLRQCFVVLAAPPYCDLATSSARNSHNPWCAPDGINLDLATFAAANSCP